MPEYQTLR